MRTIVIYPGRFQPGHKGHKSSYDYLANKFGAENVYVATSNVTAPVTNPFSFAAEQFFAKQQYKELYKQKPLTGKEKAKAATYRLLGKIEKLDINKVKNIMGTNKGRGRI